QSYSRIVFTYFFIITTLILPLSRIWLRRLFLASRRPGYQTRALIVGCDELGQRTAERLSDRPELGVEVVGFLAAESRINPRRVCNLPILGVYDDVAKVIHQHGVGLVLIALPFDFQQRIGHILDLIADEMVEVKLVPDFYRFTSLGGSVEEFDGLHIISLRESPMHGWNRVLKRGLDILVAGLSLAVVWPVMLLTALAVKLTSRGPVFYVQARMGLDGRIFKMYKFRTMRVGAEQHTGPVWAQPGDSRRTPLGRFLRRFSIDELPQLIHVLKGEMSLVGPRPERPELIENFRRSIPRYMLRHKMKAGMTGWAQVNGLRGNTSLEDRIDHDLEYIQNWSLGFDVKVLAKTLWSVVVDKHAY
ncbi:MAG: undecaprenyl-phosphate glucose phosphotransferase, partial [Deltaproteobacteria bacterium]|nr:undecaprenyl-phosphate glucose phosphotransferase [Deltaproteobacteria bacterium]